MKARQIIVDGEPVEIRRVRAATDRQAAMYEIFFPNFERLYGARYQWPIGREWRKELMDRLAMFRAIEANMNWLANRHNSQ
ncbi:hypothetical protein [Microbulbifer magnicolonia]|uniref:hypothetical protein n=1 Tax=Microbulbifer magnicolonia TaxID=3109744 RepID=UPI002B4168BB|nr:hypothetical protein [Microbulbifer sp. GG15]